MRHDGAYERTKVGRIPGVRLMRWANHGGLSGEKRSRDDEPCGRETGDRLGPPTTRAVVKGYADARKDAGGTTSAPPRGLNPIAPKGWRDEI